MREDIISRRDPASFRDPAASVYIVRRKVYREIYPAYFPEYDRFMEKIYPELVEQGLIIPHEEISRSEDRITIAPAMVPFISYPYEWSFAMLKEAALVTLRVNEIALAKGMMLKDASAYNVQYYQGRMRFIDTSSFMFYSGDTPWPSYSQFLRHFVAPMLWIKYCNPRLGRLSELYLDGIPIPLTAHMLPFHTKVNARFIEHIYAQTIDLVLDDPGRIPKMTKIALYAFLIDLYKFVKHLYYKPILGHSWVKYAEAGSYSSVSLYHKEKIVFDCLYDIQGRSALDLGANTGIYSRIAATQGYDVIAVDADHDCMFSLHDTKGVLPLVVDLCNPSPGIGWSNHERRGFWDRIGKANVILALALIHHLSVRNNIPLGLVADLLADYCDNLIIEWVPLEDKQATKLLGNKKIPEYNQAVFLAEFSRRFNIIRTCPINGSERVIYLMESK